MKYLLIVILIIGIYGCGEESNKSGILNSKNAIKNEDKQININYRSRSLMKEKVTFASYELKELNNKIKDFFDDLQIDTLEIEQKDDLYVISFNILHSSDVINKEQIKMLKILISNFLKNSHNIIIKHKKYIYTINGKKIKSKKKRLIETRQSRNFSNSINTNKKTIVLNPGHGYYYNEEKKVWKYQRDVYNGVLEDENNNVFATNLFYQLKNTEKKYNLYSVRPLTDDNKLGNSYLDFNTWTKFAWEEAARENLKNILPNRKDIWDRASSNKTEHKDINSRPRYANYLNADLLVSIHSNGTRFPKANKYTCFANGTQILYTSYNNSFKNSKIFSKLLADNIEQIIHQNYNNSWNVEIEEENEHAENWLSNSPSAIIEIAYHDCKDDARALLDTSFQNYFNQAIVKSINEYFNIESYLDGAGSIINTKGDCWGCQHDEARMHPHNLPSTVVFQWTHNDKCENLKIGIAKPNSGVISNEEMNVIIHSKEWDKLKSKTFFATLPTTISSSVYWNTTAITTTEKLTATKRIIAECTDEVDELSHIDKNINSVYLKNNTIWTGNGSLITKDNKINRQIQNAGVRQDWVKTSNDSYTTVFQWQPSEECSKLKISLTNNISLKTKKMEIKKWYKSTWNNLNCNNTLPCELTAPDLKSYYLIKIEGNSNSTNGDLIHAECMFR